MKVFIHISDDSLYLGNGGARSQFHLAAACQEMGYETFVFGQNDLLKWPSFDWLSFPAWLDFDIVPMKYLAKQKGDYRIVTSWLNRLTVGQAHLLYGLDLAKMRYLERDELARGKYAGVARFVQRNFAVIGISNRALIPFYIGFSKIIPIENWFGRDLFYYTPAKKIPGSIGFQGRNKPQYQSIEKRFGRVIVCEGNQARVAGRMRRAEFFIYANPPKKSITLYSGEGFGNPLYEAMACGCIVLAVKHNGTAYLEDTIPLVHDVPEAMTLIKILSEGKKREIREKSLALVEERFRLNDEKKRSIGRFLE